MSEQIQVSSLGALGAKVQGVDIAQVTPDQMQALQEAFAAYEVLFFVNQHLAPQAHWAWPSARVQ